MPVAVVGAARTAAANADARPRRSKRLISLLSSVASTRLGVRACEGLTRALKAR
jgi:hypothetical protein